MRSLGLIHPLIILALIISACGPSAEETRQSTLRYTFTGVNAARDGFVVWDQLHQDQIVDGATSLEEGKKALADYRQKRQRVQDGFEIVYRSLALAALELNVSSLSAALLEVKELYQTLRDLTGKDFAPDVGN